MDKDPQGSASRIAGPQTTRCGHFLGTFGHRSLERVGAFGPEEGTVPEAGGPATQSGIFYQNSVAALALADLLDLDPRVARERAVEVRVEAPQDVDDITVHFADGHSDSQSVKLAIRGKGREWSVMWGRLAAHAATLDSDDQLSLVVGEKTRESEDVAGLCERAASSVDATELGRRLTSGQASASVIPLLALTLRRVTTSSSVRTALRTSAWQRICARLTLSRSFSNGALTSLSREDGLASYCQTGFSITQATGPTVRRLGSFWPRAGALPRSSLYLIMRSESPERRTRHRCSSSASSRPPNSIASTLSTSD